MSTASSESSAEDVNNRSFWMPGNYQRTVKRTEDSFQACNDIVACFQERARVERQYAQQLSEWSTKWKPVVDSSPLYGSLFKAWQCFMSSADRLASLHASICRSLVSEDGDRVRTWQKETFHKKLFGGFKESQDVEMGFARAQKPWAKRLKKLDKARRAYHKVSRKEQAAREREAHAQGNPDVPIDKQKKIQEERELVQQEAEKVRSRYEKVLEEVNRYAPRYMEEMESIFDQSQDEERKRIAFLKQAFISIHKHLDITNNESVRAVYTELHNTLMAIDEQEDLRWWRNTHGPGMPTDWPHFQEWAPDKKVKKGKKEEERSKDVVKKATIERSVMIGGVRVRALYDYAGQETDELSFKAGKTKSAAMEQDSPASQVLRQAAVWDRLLARALQMSFNTMPKGKDVSREFREATPEQLPGEALVVCWSCSRGTFRPSSSSEDHVLQSRVSVRAAAWPRPGNTQKPSPTG